MTKIRVLLATVAALVFIMTGNTDAALAAEIAGGSAIRITEPVEGDLLVAGRNVEIRATVKGDLAVAGGRVSIEQPVNGYAMAAGRTIQVNGPIRDDLWAAGATIEVNAPIGDNAMLAGREINLDSSAGIRGDGRIAAATVNIEAPIERNVKIYARTARIASEIGGSVQANVQRLRVMPGATIRGDLLVNGPHPPEIASGATVVGQVRFNEVAQRSQWRWLLWWLFSFAALLTLGFAAIAFSPWWTEHVASKIRERPGASFATGLLGLLLLPIIAGLLLATIIGIPLAVTLLALYVVAILLSGVFVAYLLGEFLLDRIGQRDASAWARMLVGALVVSLVTSLPWIGGIAQLIVLLVGFGALVLERRESSRGPRPAVATA
ncbi:MAG TPA: hypothetical protein VNO43_14755 [Candidatus Eisenbacteria bacterium]|nr:hypothetical protein [Candidatus Eisenbacteria bacterium]